MAPNKNYKNKQISQHTRGKVSYRLLYSVFLFGFEQVSFVVIYGNKLRPNSRFKDLNIQGAL